MSNVNYAWSKEAIEQYLNTFFKNTRAEIKTRYYNKSLVFNAICNNEVPKDDKYYKVYRYTDNTSETGTICISKAGAKDLIDFDRKAMDSVYTLIRNGYEYATLDMIARAIYEDPDFELDEETKTFLLTCLYRLFATRIDVIMPDGKTSIRTPLFMMDIATIGLKDGRTITSYKLEVPSIYTYAERAGLIEPVPVNQE